VKKIIWLTLFISLLVVNGLAMAAEAFSGTYIPLPYRLAVVLAIVLVTLVFCGATVALKQAESEVQPEEQSLTKNSKKS
jgi:hypothetical protein